MNDYLYGLKKAIPVSLAYIATSFAFGVMCANNGMTPLVSTIISFTNLTSAGQFAGAKLIFVTASFLEIFITVLVINLRYALMSTSLSQKINPKMKRSERLLISFGITDEIFALAITEEREVNTKYFLGLMTLPIIGWSLGTFLGALSAGIFSERLLAAMNICLYTMFIGIIIPDTRKDKTILFVILIAVAITCVFEYVPYINNIGLGFKTIIATIVASTIGAMFFKRKKGDKEALNE